MKKTVTCILSFLPALMIAITFIVMFFVLIIVGDEPMNTIGIIGMVLLVIFELIGVFLALGLIVWYMIIACKSPKLSVGMKVFWCIMLYCFNLFVFPIFWFCVILKEE